MALYDAETGLPCRTLALDRLSVANARCFRTGATVAVMLIDVGGDIATAARQLDDVTRAGDTVARIGHAELVLIVDDLASPADAEAVANRALARLGGGRVAIGVAVSAAEARTAEEMLDEAGRALARARERDGGYDLFDDDHVRERALDQANADAVLRNAIASGELLLHYQPIVDTGDGLARGVEALVRWKHPEHGLLGPQEFVPVAEQSGAIIALGDWVLREACQRVRAWQAKHRQAEALWLAVNVSRSQLEHPSIVSSVQRALLESGLAADRLYLEVAQPDLAGDVTMVSSLRQLRALGARISIDDADASWRQAIGDASADMVKARPSEIMAVLEATPAGIEVVAQRVEDREHEQRLRERGCGLGQGYLYARPATPEDIDAMLAALPVEEELLTEPGIAS